MLLRSEEKSLLDREPRFDDIMCNLRATAVMPRGVINETKKVIAFARKFVNEVVEPNALALDMAITKDPDHIPWEVARTISDRGIYTMWMPKMFGGGGYCMTTLAHFIEEVASVCLGLTNVVGAHYLGFVVAGSSGNLALMKKLSKEIVEGQRKGKPVLFSLALTEPNAGTDMEEVDLMDKGLIGCHAEKVKGGYVVNGTKVFISGGHLATWHTLVASSDLKNPSENPVMMVVKTGTKGFSFGRVEKKMGQKACPASELVFKDCFVPDEWVCFDKKSVAHLQRSVRQTNSQIVDFYFAASRAGVGALGTGAARGAYEKALKFATETVVDGTLLINHEWVQCLLAEMYENVSVSRLTWMEANNANVLDGVYKHLQGKISYYALKVITEKLFGSLIDKLLDSPKVMDQASTKLFDDQTDEQILRTSGWASLSKVTGADAGVRNAHLAMEIMGQKGLRHDWGAEKIFRDAKLLQIYEGSNQLNRLNLFKCFVADHDPRIRVFDNEK